MSDVTDLAAEPPQTNGFDPNMMDDEERAKIRPADIDADVREMERRKRVELIMNSRLFREELERIIEVQIREGSGTSGLMQQISEMMGGVSKNAGNVFKNSNCVVPINDIRGIEAMGYAKGEKILRCKLACVYRLIDLYGWTQGANIITARLNHDEEHFLVNPYGMLFHEITASSLIKADMQGHVIEQGTTNFSVNLCIYSLHAAIHSARPDIKCIIHVHTPSVVAISALKCGLLPLSQESVVIGDVSTHAYAGGVSNSEEKDKIARNLGPNNKVLLLSNQGAVCCGETIEEAFFNARNTVLASESQLKLMPVGIDNLLLLSDEMRKQMYDAAHKAPESTPRPDQPSILEQRVERKWRVGGTDFEALMRMLDNAGFRTGYIYRHPLVKGEPPRPRNDVEVPPAVSSLGYLLEEEELYRAGLWKKLEGGRKGHDRSRWLNSPNVYQKVEILETGTPDPKKITKWVTDGSPTHSSSSSTRIDCALQFVPKNTNPKEFKKLQQQIKDYRRADKISAGPQSHILEGVTWEEAKKMQDAGVTQTGDQVVLMGAASKGIIQRGYQHNATMYKAPYAKNPFDCVTDEELDEYKKVVEKKVKGEYDTDYSESEGLSSAQINKRISDIRSPTSAASETEEESRDEPRVLRIETKHAPKASQPEVVLSDDQLVDDVFIPAPQIPPFEAVRVTTRNLPPIDRRSNTNSMRRRKVVKLYQSTRQSPRISSSYRTNSFAGLPKGSYAIPNPIHYHLVRYINTTSLARPALIRLPNLAPSITTFSNYSHIQLQPRPNYPQTPITLNLGPISTSLNISLDTLHAFIYPFANALNLIQAGLNSQISSTQETKRTSSSQTAYNTIQNVEEAVTPFNLHETPQSSFNSFEKHIMSKLHKNLIHDLTINSDEESLSNSTPDSDKQATYVANNEFVFLKNQDDSYASSFNDSLGNNEKFNLALNESHLKVTHSLTKIDEDSIYSNLDDISQEYLQKLQTAKQIISDTEEYVNLVGNANSKEFKDDLYNPNESGDYVDPNNDYEEIDGCNTPNIYETISDVDSPESIDLSEIKDDSDDPEDFYEKIDHSVDFKVLETKLIDLKNNLEQLETMKGLTIEQDEKLTIDEKDQIEDKHILDQHEILKGVAIIEQDTKLTIEEKDHMEDKNILDQHETLKGVAIIEQDTKITIEERDHMEDKNILDQHETLKGVVTIEQDKKLTIEEKDHMEDKNILDQHETLKGVPIIGQDKKLTIEKKDHMEDKNILDQQETLKGVAIIKEDKKLTIEEKDHMKDKNILDQHETLKGVAIIKEDKKLTIEEKDHMEDKNILDQQETLKGVAIIEQDKKLTIEKKDRMEDKNILDQQETLKGVAIIKEDKKLSIEEKDHMEDKNILYQQETFKGVAIIEQDKKLNIEEQFSNADKIDIEDDQNVLLDDIPNFETFDQPQEREALNPIKRALVFEDLSKEFKDNPRYQPPLAKINAIKKNLLIESENAFKNITHATPKDIIPIKSLANLDKTENSIDYDEPSEYKELSNSTSDELLLIIKDTSDDEALIIKELRNENSSDNDKSCIDTSENEKSCIDSSTDDKSCFGTSPEEKSCFETSENEENLNIKPEMIQACNDLIIQESDNEEQENDEFVDDVYNPNESRNLKIEENLNTNPEIIQDCNEAENDDIFDCFCNSSLETMFPNVVETNCSKIVKEATNLNESEFGNCSIEVNVRELSLLNEFHNEVEFLEIAQVHHQDIKENISTDVNLSTLSANENSSNVINQDEFINQMGELILNYIIKNCLELDEIIIFPELLEDENVLRLFAKLDNLYKEYYINSFTGDQKSELCITIAQLVMRKLELHDLNDPNMVTDKIFTISEFLADMLDYFFGKFDDVPNTVFDEFKHELGGNQVKHSTPQTKITKPLTQNDSLDSTDDNIRITIDYDAMTFKYLPNITPNDIKEEGLQLIKDHISIDINDVENDIQIPTDYISININDSIEDLSLKVGDDNINTVIEMDFPQGDLLETQVQECKEIKANEHLIVDDNQINIMGNNEVDSVISFRTKRRGSGNEAYWLSIHKSPKVDSPRPPTWHVINVDDIPLRPPKEFATQLTRAGRSLYPIPETPQNKLLELLDKNESPNKLNVSFVIARPLSPIDEECRKSLLNDFDAAEKQFIEESRNSNTPALSDNAQDLQGYPNLTQTLPNIQNIPDDTHELPKDDNNLLETLIEQTYVHFEQPEINTIVSDEVQFFRTTTLNVSSYVKSSNVSFNKNNLVGGDGSSGVVKVPKKNRKNRKIKHDKENDSGDWLGYESAKF